MSDPVNPTRRSFLRGSSFVMLTAVLAPRPGFGSVATGEQTSSGQRQETDDKVKGTGDRSRAEDSAAEPQEKKPDEPDQSRFTKKDAQGREYRICPQCGYNMYCQDRTWTCENCGYSYVD